MEVPMAWNGGVTESEIVGRDVEEAVPGKDGRGRRSFEALAARTEWTDDVRIRWRVVERHRCAMHVRNRGKRPGFSGHGDHAGDRGRPCEPLAGQDGVIGAIRHFV